MNTDDFEQHLSRQGPRPIPPEWREEILAAALPPSQPVASRPSWLTTLLWPSPKAWAGLAAAWLVALCIQIGVRGHPRQMMPHVASTSPAIQKVLHAQRQMLVELLGTPAETKAEPTKPRTPPHRSEISPHSWKDATMLKLEVGAVVGDGSLVAFRFLSSPPEGRGSTQAQHVPYPNRSRAGAPCDRPLPTNRNCRVAVERDPPELCQVPMSGGRGSTRALQFLHFLRPLDVVDLIGRWHPASALLRMQGRSGTRPSLALEERIG